MKGFVLLVPRSYPLGNCQIFGPILKPCLPEPGS